MALSKPGAAANGSSRDAALARSPFFVTAPRRWRRRPDAYGIWQTALWVLPLQTPPHAPHPQSAQQHGPQLTSQVSPDSQTPLPHTGEQSAAQSFAFSPASQIPLPQAPVHNARHVAAVPGPPQNPLLMQYGIAGVPAQSASVKQCGPTVLVTQTSSTAVVPSQWSTQNPVPHVPHVVAAVHVAGVGVAVGDGGVTVGVAAGTVCWSRARYRLTMPALRVANSSLNVPALSVAGYDTRTVTSPAGAASGTSKNPGTKSPAAVATATISVARGVTERGVTERGVTERGVTERGGARERAAGVVRHVDAIHAAGRGVRRAVDTADRVGRVARGHGSTAGFVAAPRPVGAAHVVDELERAGTHAREGRRQSGRRAQDDQGVDVVDPTAAVDVAHRLRAEARQRRGRTQDVQGIDVGDRRVLVDVAAFESVDRPYEEDVHHDDDDKAREDPAYTPHRQLLECHIDLVIQNEAARDEDARSATATAPRAHAPVHPGGRTGTDEERRLSRLGVVVASRGAPCHRRDARDARRTASIMLV